MKNAYAVALLSIFASTVNGADLAIREVAGDYPKEGMTTEGSGSGLIIGPRHVLTNRHVVENDNRKAYGGFNIYLGPEFSKKSRRARVTHVSDHYDLAILELGEAVEAPTVRILDGIPPLATKVTAYGFPLGSQCLASLGSGKSSRLG